MDFRHFGILMEFRLCCHCSREWLSLLYVVVIIIIIDVIIVVILYHHYCYHYPLYLGWVAIVHGSDRKSGVGHGKRSY